MVIDNGQPQEATGKNRRSHYQVTGGSGGKTGVSKSNFYLIFPNEKIAMIGRSIISSNFLKNEDRD